MATISFGRSSSTMVRQESSNRCMVFLSTRPTRCRPSTVLWTDRRASLRYFLLAIVHHLHQFLCGHALLDGLVVISQQQCGEFAVDHELVRFEISFAALRKAVHEHAAITRAPDDDRAKPSAASLP